MATPVVSQVRRKPPTTVMILNFPLPQRKRWASQGKSEPKQDGCAAQRYIETPSNDGEGVARDVLAI